MSNLNKAPLGRRMKRGAQSRAYHRLQHLLLRSIEILPAPYKFAWRNTLFSRFGTLFASNATYEKWLKACDYFLTQRPAQIELIDLSNVQATELLPAKKIAIQAHIFYPDLAPELAQLLQDFPVPFDLLISTPDVRNEALLQAQFASLPKLAQLKMLITPNQGRDLGPLLYGFGKVLLEYDYFAHVHTKKSSATNQIGDAWRQYLFNGLLNNRQERVSKILGLLKRYGMVYPQKFALIDIENCHWGKNLPAAEAFCTSVNVPTPTPGYIEFPVGSMFWAKTAALKPLLMESFIPESFEPEMGQTDNTLAHALERSLTHIALSQGYPIAILKAPHWLDYYP